MRKKSRASGFCALAAVYWRMKGVRAVVWSGPEEATEWAASSAATGPVGDAISMGKISGTGRARIPRTGGRGEVGLADEDAEANLGRRARDGDRPLRIRNGRRNLALQNVGQAAPAKGLAATELSEPCCFTILL